MRLLNVLGALMCAATATAQVTSLGGGVSPLFVSGNPTPGGTVWISPLPSSFPFVILGITRVDLPLTALGAQCPDVQVPRIDVLAPITYTLTIPNDANLIGVSVYTQGVLGGVPACFVGAYIQLSEAVEIRIQ